MQSREQRWDIAENRQWILYCGKLAASANDGNAYAQKIKEEYNNQLSKLKQLRDFIETCKTKIESAEEAGDSKGAKSAPSNLDDWVKLNNLTNQLNPFIAEVEASFVAAANLQSQADLVEVLRHYNRLIHMPSDTEENAKALKKALAKTRGWSDLICNIGLLLLGLTLTAASVLILYFSMANLLVPNLSKPHPISRGDMTDMYVNTLDAAFTLSGVLLGGIGVGLGVLTGYYGLKSLATSSSFFYNSYQKSKVATKQSDVVKDASDVLEKVLSPSR